MQSWEADFAEVTYSDFASAAKPASECISLQKHVAVGAWRLNALCWTECGKHKRKTPAWSLDNTELVGITVTWNSTWETDHKVVHRVTKVLYNPAAYSYIKVLKQQQKSISVSLLCNSVLKCQHLSSSSVRQQSPCTVNGVQLLSVVDHFPPTRTSVLVICKPSPQLLLHWLLHTVLHWTVVPQQLSFTSTTMNWGTGTVALLQTSVLCLGLCHLFRVWTWRPTSSLSIVKMSLPVWHGGGTKRRTLMST